MNEPNLSSLIDSPAPRVSPDASLRDAAQVMSGARVSALLVCEGDHVLGLLTRGDLVRELARGSDPLGPVSVSMRSPVFALSGDLNPSAGYQRLLKRGVRHLLVTDSDGDPLGVLHESDLLRHLQRNESASGLDETKQALALLRASEGRLRTLIDTIPDADGRLVGVLGIGRDISALRHAEDVLRESAERFRLFYENAPVAYQSLDPMGRILEVNPAWLSLLGLDSDDRRQVIGRSFGDFVDPSQHPLLAQRFSAFLERGEVNAVEYDLLGRDGQVVSVMIDGRVGHDASGSVQQTHCVLHDVTERKRHEASLALQARRADALLELPKVAETGDETAFIQRGLELIEGLTDSPISFLHFVNPDQETIELVAWSRRTLSTYCSAIHDRHYPVGEAGIWADAVRRGEPVVFNDYARVTHRRGLPPGHASLERLISLPVIEQGKVVLLLGVGNKTTNYTDLDVEAMQLIANEIWRLVQHRRGLSALAASEARYRELVENMSDGVAVYEAMDEGRDFVFRDYNRAAERIGLLPRDQVIGYRLTETYPGAEEMGLLDLIRRVWKSGESEYFPIRNYKDDRIDIWADNHAFKLQTGEVVAVYNDVTAQRQAQQQITRFSRVLERSLNEIYIFDSRTLRFMDVNLGARTNLGYTLEELRALTPVDLKSEVSAQDYARLLEPLRSGLEQKVVFSTHQRRKDGTLYPVEAHIQLMDEEPPVFVAIIQDITERAQAEEALRASEEKYRLIVENQTDLVVKVDTAGRFEFVSPSYCALFGRSEADLLGQPFMPLVHEQDREATVKAMDAIQRPPYTIYLEQRAMTKDGWRWLGWMDTAIRDEQGRVTSIIGVGRDIQERKRAESESAVQLDELRRWHQATLGREGRVLELKGEVNALLAELGRPLGYPSARAKGPDRGHE